MTKATETNVKTETYKGYEFSIGKDQVEVFDPRWPAKPTWVGETVDSAEQWVNAYRKGAAWAVAEAENNFQMTA